MELGAFNKYTKHIQNSMYTYLTHFYFFQDSVGSALLDKVHTHGGSSHSIDFRSWLIIN